MSDYTGNYTFTFMITIAMQALATLGYCVLLPLVISSRPEDVKKRRAEARRAMAVGVEPGGDLGAAAVM